MIRFVDLPTRALTLLVMLGTAWQASATAEDVVLVRRLQPPGVTPRRGTILDYTGEALTLGLSGDRQEKIPTQRVVSYQTTMVPEHTLGDQLFAQDRFAEAVVSYQRAAEQDTRTWVRRILMAQMVQCRTNMQQLDRAGELFRWILRSDPTTQLLDAMPLAWSTTQTPPDLLEPAREWLKLEDEPLMNVMAASWLMGSADRPQALDTLTRLADSDALPAAQLAKTQLWRVQLVTASVEDIAAWERQLAELAPSLRAGPYYLIGQGWARHGRREAAALALMRVPILFPENKDLAAESLLAAGEQLEKMGDPAGAAAIYRELLQTCQKHRLAPVAQQRLERTNAE